METEARANIDRLNEAQSGQPYKLAMVNINDFELLDKNARYMTNEMFRNLVENIKRDGGLTSTPFCVKEGDKYRVLSGNHWVQAAKEAGLTEILVMYTERKLSQQEQIAIQLSHNSIAGRDDMAILKQLWEEIDDLSLKYYAGLDDKTLEELKKINLDALSEVKLDYRSLAFLFLPEEIERLEQVFKSAVEQSPAKDICVAGFKGI